MTEYFSLFPTTTYANTRCLDVFRRVVVRDSITHNPLAYLPYEVKAGERIDQVAQHYYGSPDDAWMVMLSAKVLDPYYGWYLPESSFQAHVRAKYGSWEIASDLVRHYQLNWHADDRELTVSGYEALTPNLRKYWEPHYGVGSQILSYMRRREDWTASTNLLLRLTVNCHSNAVFLRDERVQLFSGATLTGQAQVSWANSSVVRIRCVSGDAGVGNTVTGNTSLANATITAMAYQSNTIPVDERDYWSAVSYLEWEQDKNEKLKNVRLVDARFSVDMREELRRKLA